MTRKFAFLGLLLLIGGFPAQSQTLTVEITSPVDGSSVGERPYVEGSVSSRQAAVWVVVRPMESIGSSRASPSEATVAGR